jgi:cytochrome c oxidase subunit 3/cytochrome o ubiquinol oxidase subunit 3
MEQENAASLEITSLGVDNRKLGVWVWLGSEAVFFSALIVVYIVMRNRSISGPYPREALNVTLTAINTFVLICSSLTMVTALSAIQSGSQKGLWRWLVATMVLGLLFLGGQAFEFTSLANQGLSLSSNLFGGTFFTLTGFHGAHVLIGVIWIGFVVARARRGGYTQSSHLMVELTGLYWHFVDLVWIIIFTLVYLI